MFDALNEILKTCGCGIHGFQKCALAALESGYKEPKLAVPYFLLGSAAEHFVNLYDRQPLPTLVAEEEFRKFESYVNILEKAYSSNSTSEKIDALNFVANDIIMNRIS